MDFSYYISVRYLEIIPVVVERLPVVAANTDGAGLDSRTCVDAHPPGTGFCVVNGSFYIVNGRIIYQAAAGGYGQYGRQYRKEIPNLRLGQIKPQV